MRRQVSINTAIGENCIRYFEVEDVMDFSNAITTISQEKKRKTFFCENPALDHNHVAINLVPLKHL